MNDLSVCGGCVVLCLFLGRRFLCALSVTCPSQTPLLFAREGPGNKAGGVGWLVDRLRISSLTGNSRQVHGAGNENEDETGHLKALLNSRFLL